MDLVEVCTIQPSPAGGQPDAVARQPVVLLAAAAGGGVAGGRLVGPGRLQHAGAKILVIF